MEELIINNRTFMNPYLQKATDAIRKYDIDIRTNRFAIAYVMGRVDTDVLYSDDGYDSAVAWAMDAFRINKTLAYNLITLGRDWVQEVRNAKGKLLGYASNLVECDNSMPLVDYTVSQLARLSTLGHDSVARFHADGVISPNMTVREIQAFINSVKEAEKQLPATEQPAEQPTTEQPAEQDTHYPHAIGKREVAFDAINTEMLIAELRARGFTVQRDGHEYLIDWTVSGE